MFLYIRGESIITDSPFLHFCKKCDICIGHQIGFACGYPEIKAVLWWDEDWRHHKGGVDSRIDSTPKALQAFKEGITDPYFLDTVPYQKNA